MNTEQLKIKRVKWNKTYIDGQKRKGVIIRSFRLPRVLVDQVKQYIKEQSAILNNTRQEKA